jgi:hypothetical protein
MFINYTLYPIFQLNPGGPGLIPIPGFNESKVYWQPTAALTTFSDLPDADTIIATNSFNYSLCIDIVVLNPYASATGYVVIFNRGGTINKNPPANSAITGTIYGYNLAMALAPNTNDLVVSMMNSYNNPENVLIQNVPVQTPFRVGVVVFGNAFEVYLNGKLIKTRIFASGSVIHQGDFQGPKGISTARVGNLILWKHPVAASEIRYATPSLMPSISTDSPSIFASCAAVSDVLSGIGNSITDAAGAII